MGIQPPTSATPQSPLRPVASFSGGKPIAPKKIGKDVTPQKGSAKFLISVGLTLVGLFVMFVVLMVMVIASGGEESPALKALGVSGEGIKSFLVTVINLSFGFLSLLFFVFLVVGVFRMLMAKKGDKEASKRGVRMTLLGLIPMVILMVLWLVLYQFVSAIQITSSQGKEEITVVSPADLTGLTAPVEITFSSENVVKAIQRQKLNVTDVRWDMNGDGAYETYTSQFEVSYLFETKGNWTVGLQVTVQGEEKPRVYTYSVPIGEALFTANPASGTAPLTVAFDASNLVPPGKKYSSVDWDFEDDGTYEESKKDGFKVSHVFDKVGTFNVHLRLVDQNNVVENYYRKIEVTLSEKPLLSAIIDVTPGLSGQIPLQIQFDGSRSESLKGTITRYEWNFGDGTPIQVGRNVSHIYNNPGAFTASLKVVEDSGKEATSTVSVDAKAVSSVPEPKITTTPVPDSTGGVKGNVPLKVAFDASTSTDPDKNIVDYEWDFGIEGAKATGQKAEYTYDKAGTYTVTLLLRDATKLEATATMTVVVSEPGVSAVITANPEEGTAPLIVQFDGSSSTTFRGKIVSYEWNFGDKSPSTITGAQISHKYNAVGTYPVKLKVVTNMNESGTAELLVYVREIPLKACFTPSRHNGLAPLTVTFDSLCSTGPVAKYTWDFGDGQTSDARKPNHTFENPGTYNVVLEVADDKSNVSTYNDVIVAEGQVKP